MHPRIFHFNPLDLIDEDLRKHLFGLSSGRPWDKTPWPEKSPGHPKPKSPEAPDFRLPEGWPRPRIAPVIPVVMAGENERGYCVTMLLPGVDPADISVELTAQRILVTGPLPPHQVTPSQKTFTWVHTVPTQYQPTAENMTAELKHGVLSIRVTGAPAPTKVTIPLRTE